MTRTNAYYRGRLTAIYNLIDSLKNHPVYDHSAKGAKFTDRELLKSGWVNPALKDLLEDGIFLTKNTDNSPLTFVELVTLNTWFAMHPEKVCGDEFVSTSMNFPLQMKAPKEYVERKIRESLKKFQQDKLSLQIKVAKAKMKMKLAIALALKSTPNK